MSAANPPLELVSAMSRLRTHTVTARAGINDARRQHSVKVTLDLITVAGLLRGIDECWAEVVRLRGEVQHLEKQ